MNYITIQVKLSRKYNQKCSFMHFFVRSRAANPSYLNEIERAWTGPANSSAKIECTFR